MKKDLLVIVVLVSMIAADCSSSKSVAKHTPGVWMNTEKIQGQSYHNIFIVVLTADIQARLQFENDLATIAIARGYKVVKSSDLLPPSLENPKVPAKDDVVAKVETSGCDALLVASLLKKDEAAHYTPGKTAYGITPYATYYPGYYSYWQPTVSTPDYYSHDKTYFMESNFYDVASKEIMWSVQSEVFNPSSLKKFSSTYTNTLIGQLEKAGLLKK